jgi:hypothetical protein
LPDRTTLLLEVIRHAPLEMQHSVQGILRHRPRQSCIQQAHYGHIDRQIRIVQYGIDAGAEDQDRLQVRQSREGSGSLPPHQGVADFIGRPGVRPNAKRHAR